MAGKGTTLRCDHCGKEYELTPLGELKAREGETEFTHIPDWFAWEREQVKKQIEDGTYVFEDEVDVWSLPRVWRYIPLGKAKLTHTIENGFELEGHYRGDRYYIHRQCAQTNSLHVEYNFSPLGGADFLDVSTENDSFYCRPTKQNVLTKLAFATEELYLRSQQKRKRPAREQ